MRKKWSFPPPKKKERHFYTAQRFSTENLSTFKISRNVVQSNFKRYSLSLFLSLYILAALNYERTDSCNNHRPPLINEANIKFYLLETLENITSNQQKVRSFSQRRLCHANRSTRLDETRAWCARFAAAEGTGGKEASWKGGEESSSLHSGVVAAAERCSVGFHRGGCLAATTELYLSAV